MARAAFLVALIALGDALPERCARTLGKAPPEPSATTDPKPSAPTDPPLPLPITSATTPPVWVPPEVSAATPAPPEEPNPELAKARALAQTGDNKKIRALLDKRVRAGRASEEEAVLLLDACSALRDKACIELIKLKHPDLVGR